jgi:hypothetical protein
VKPEIQAAGPAEELRVIAALHALGADLGEPVEVKREGGRVMVGIAGLGGGRREEVRAALSGIPGVYVNAEEAPGAPVELKPRGLAAEPDAADPLLAGLDTFAAEQIVDRTETLIERAYALRGLARRFPPEVEAQLSAADVEVLRDIARAHTHALRQALADLRRLLPAPSGTGGAAPPAAWQHNAEAIFTTVQRLDTALNSSAAEVAMRKARLAEALDRLTVLAQP